MILSYNSYIEVIEQKEQQVDEIADLKNTMNVMLQAMVSKGWIEPIPKTKESI